MIVSGMWGIFSCPIYKAPSVIKASCSLYNQHKVKRVDNFCSECGSTVTRTPIEQTTTGRRFRLLSNELRTFITKQGVTLFSTSGASIIASGYLTTEQELTSDARNDYFCVLFEESSTEDPDDYEYSSFIISKSEVFKETLNEQERAELCDLFQDALRGGDLVGVFNMNCYIADE